MSTTDLTHRPERHPILAAGVRWATAGLVLTACSPKVVDIGVTGLPSHAREGATATVRAVATDASGAVVPKAMVTWAISPPDSASREGDLLHFLKEGPVDLSWTSGDAKRTTRVVVDSPLLGEFERDTPPLKGMRIRIRNLGGALVGEISKGPDVGAAAVTAMVEFWSNRQDISPDAIPKIVECSGERFGVGLRKLNNIRRLDAGTWETESLTLVPAALLNLDKPCPGATASWGKGTLARSADGSFVYQDIASTDRSVGAKQHWRFLGE